ncbi:MAG: hypothetical protein DRJ21_00850 [Candidatus Methanomethylicota archaeon]|uniref:ArnR1-like winged helix-turn-helix domain-containing protein n=1 Tax=Thermoproteota archaeon TaxID=2056631 RepID=A0A497EUN6_9CREN|nr:MAG: hypothetical protein DRJ21_00850 [Candidatus Verstraetearchaeota archaeon]
MPKNTLWPSEPLEVSILSILRKRKTMRENELFDNLRQQHNNLSPKEFNKALMKLEIWGKILVTVTKRGLRNISLIEGEYGR